MLFSTPLLSSPPLPLFCMQETGQELRSASASSSVPAAMGVSPAESGAHPASYPSPESAASPGEARVAAHRTAFAALLRLSPAHLQRRVKTIHFTGDEVS